jgi:dTDP-4-amino-4,6-dideoxygalactose transaminase
MTMDCDPFSGAARDGLIGGVFAAVDPPASVFRSVWDAWTADGTNAAGFQTARGALATLLKARGARRLWLPAYVCADVVSAAEAAGIPHRFYGVENDLEPQPRLLALEARPGDAVLGVDYFGKPAGAAWRNLVEARPDLLWIEDRAQAPLPGGTPWGDAIVYSARKMMAVADGAVLVGRRVAAPQPMEPLPADAEARGLLPLMLRAADPEGTAAAEWYAAFRHSEDALAPSGWAMSARSRVALDQIDLDALAARRLANARTLAAQLHEFLLWPEIGPWAPGYVPILVADPAGAVRALAAEGCFCPRHWAYLPSPQTDFPAAHFLAAHLVSLPCDQRYVAADMERLAAAVRRHAVPPAAPERRAAS